MIEPVVIIGGGLAGSEAAWQLAKRGVPVELFEMRPTRPTPVHKSDGLAELVCSNSLGSKNEGTAPYLLKREMLNLDSLIIKTAEKYSVPAGGALSVDRELFSRAITETLDSHSNISVIREEVTKIPDRPIVILASGPLTSPDLSNELTAFLGQEHLYFYDALSPIVDAHSIDTDKTFLASRYGKGTDDYLNCPMNKDEYDQFVQALIDAEKVPFKEFEKPKYFEGCMPIEELARRGAKTLAFGPLKPVGLNHPETGKKHYAVLQLRQENKAGAAYNLVGFQTKMTYPEQKRVFRMIPGLEKVEFFRYGAIHRNTYINAPKHLNDDLSAKHMPNLFLAGQITGVEGYVESAAMGLIASLSALSRLNKTKFNMPPENTALGVLNRYLTTDRGGNYQPMNINFGLFSGDVFLIRDKKQRNKQIIEDALIQQKAWILENEY